MEQNHVTLEERKVGVAAPKMFAFDNVFTDMDSQEEVANSALSDIIASGKNDIHLISFLLTKQFQYPHLPSTFVEKTRFLQH